ncbi:MAG: lipid biosynthesis acyltransferase [Firmicutes bacterium]|nr:lipid biosynthesis acyltransferase [Bacillota bacterium]
MQYHLLKIISKIVCLLPYSTRAKLGDWLGELCWPLVPQRRKTMAVNNVMQSFGLDEPAALSLVKKSATRFGRMFMEVMYFPKLNKGNISKWVTFQGQEYLDQALAYGRGVILATAHQGNWELLGQTLTLSGYPVAGVAQKQTNAAMDRFFVEYRQLAGMHVTYKTGVREMINLLGQGWIIGLLMDQDASDKGVFVDFFGRRAATPAGSAVFARMKEAPIVPTFITENGDGTHTVIIHPPLWVEKTKNRDEDIFLTTQKLTNIIEKTIREYPQEWFWLHNRWKTPPPTK